MKRKILTHGVLFVFLFTLFGFPIVEMLLPDRDYIVDERRAASPPPVLSLDSLREGSFSDGVESYLLDNLPFRESFRRLKNRFSQKILGLSDIDGYFMTENGVAMDLSPLNETRVVKNASLFDHLIDRYFPENERIFLAVIPDKACYARPAGERLDSEALTDLLDENMKSPHRRVDLFDALSLSDYFATDIHLKQEGWFSPLERLAAAMDFQAPALSDFDRLTLGEFQGTLGAQAALSAEHDILTLLYDKGGVIEDAKVTYPDRQTAGLYDTSFFATSGDKYDVFLRGEIVGEGKDRVGNFFIQVKNLKAASPRKLILFRDSFARAALPLFLPAYSEVVLVDLRAPTAFYGENARLLSADENTDILFLVSTHTLNSTDFC